VPIHSIVPVHTLIVSVVLHALAGAECPKGADHFQTRGDLRGACAVTFDGDAFLVCSPEALPRQGSPAWSASQLSRWSVKDGTCSQRTAELGFAADVDVSNDGVIAVADRAGAVLLIEVGGATRTRIGFEWLRSPSGVAWRGSDLVVSDSGLGAIFVVDQLGRELQRVGAGVLRDPQGLDVAADGSVYVADRLANCLWHFPVRENGRLADTPRAIGERGTNPGQFNCPCDVALIERGAAGRCLVVADEMNHRVQVLGEDGAFASFFGMHALFPRQGDGRIHYPRSVAVDAAGTMLAVAEPFEDRVQLFTLKPEENPPDAVGGYEFITSHFGSDVACAEDLLVLVDTESQGVALLDARTTPPIHMAVIGGLGAMTLRFTEVSAIAVEPKTARVWVADRGRGKLEVFETVWDRSKPPVLDMFMPRLVRSMDLARFTSRLNASGFSPLRVPAITDIAFDPADPSRVLLLDAANRAIISADLRLRAGTIERLPEGVRAPEEFALSDDGRLAIADPVARRVFFRDGGGPWTALADLGGVVFVCPSGVAFGPDGLLVVSDAARDACIVSARDGSARLVGERGELDEQFYEPRAIAGSPKGLIVVDRGNHRFQRFGDGFAWNLTGSMGRYYDQKRRGSPGAAPASTPDSRAKQGGES